MSSVGNRLGVAVAVAVVALAGGCLRKKKASPEPAPPAAPAAQTPPAPPALAAPGAPSGPVTPKMQAPSEARALSSAFSAVAKALRPSVVRIDVEIRDPALAQNQRRSRRGAE